MATGDPCSLLWPALLKQACENTSKLAGGSSGTDSGSGSSAGGTTGTGQSLWGLVTDPLSVVGGFRHLVLRIAEGGIGILLVVVGINALLKPSNPVKKAVKAAIK